MRIISSGFVSEFLTPILPYSHTPILSLSVLNQRRLRKSENGEIKCCYGSYS
jgi:hypothetical protein